MASNTSGVNAHAALPPAVMRDLRDSVHGTRSMERLSGLDSDKQPNLIFSGSRSGSFVRQRQAALLRSSLSSSQSSLNSLKSDRSGSFKASAHNISSSNVNANGTSNGLTRSSSMTLPRIPSKILKDRGVANVSNASANVKRHSDIIIIKRGGEKDLDQGNMERKIRRLSSQDSQQRPSAGSEPAATTTTTTTTITPAAAKLEKDVGAEASSVEVERAPSNASDVVLRRKWKPGGGGYNTSQRPQAVTSGSWARSEVVSSSRPSSSAYSERTASVTGSRPSSSHSERRSTSVKTDSRPSSASSEKNAFRSGSRPPTPSSERNAGPSNSNVSSPREGTKRVSSREGSFARQDSDTSERSLRRKGGEDSQEGDKRSSTGHGVLQMSYTSSSSSPRKSSGKKTRAGSDGSAKHRPSFHTIQGSSTPVLQRHSMASSTSPSSSSYSSPPPTPPAPLEDPSSSSPPSSPPLPLPPPPPLTPPSAAGAETTPIPGKEEAETEMKSLPPLFQPRPPSQLSAFPLPTPPPTPRLSNGHDSSLPDPASPPPPPSPTRDLSSPQPPSSPSESFPSPPPLSRPSSLASSTLSSSSPPPKREESVLDKGGCDLDFLSSLPDVLPHDGLEEGRKPLSVSGLSTETTETTTTATGESKVSITTTTTTTSMSTEKGEATMGGAMATETVFPARVERESEDETDSAAPDAAAPVIHFPPPPAYSPSLSPGLRSTRISAATSPMFPATRRSSSSSPHPELSGSEPEQPEGRQTTSTSTDVVLGYLDSALASHSSAPVTPGPFSPAPPAAAATSLSSQPDSYSKDEIPATTTTAASSSSKSNFNSSGYTNNEQTVSTATALNLNEPSFPSSTSIDSAAATEPPAKMNTQGAASTDAYVTSSEADAERLRTLKKKPKGGKQAKQAKRKITPTQVTKYEGSVKTVRRQIKPGHVEELREIFRKQSDEGLELLLTKHGKRRMKAARSGGVGDSSIDDSGSGYTTTSSDNEYDLEKAERTNSPGLASSSPSPSSPTSPTSPFSTPRSANYDGNWEEGKTSSHNTTSSENDAATKAMRSSSSGGFVFETPPLHDLSGASIGEGDQKTGAPGPRRNTSAVESSEAETAPFISNNSVLTTYFDSLDPRPSASVNGDGFVAASSLDAQGPAREKTDDSGALYTEGGQASSGGNMSTTTTTTLFSAAPKTRSSSSESETGEGGDKPLDSRNAGNLVAPTFADSDLTFQSGGSAERPAATCQRFTVATGSFGKDSNPAPLRDDGSEPTRAAHQETPVLGDGQGVIDAHYAEGECPPVTAKVTARGGVVVGGGGGRSGREKEDKEAELTMERGGREGGGGESGLATNGEREDPMTIFWANDRSDDDDTGGSEGRAAAGRAGRDAREFATAASSTASRPGLGVFGEDSIITRSVARDVTGSTTVTARRRDPLTSSQAPFDTRLAYATEVTAEQSTPAATLYSVSAESRQQQQQQQQQDPRAGDSEDFLSILDNIQLETEGFKSETVQRAKRLYADDFKGSSNNNSNRTSLEVSVSEAPPDLGPIHDREASESGGQEVTVGKPITIERSIVVVRKDGETETFETAATCTTSSAALPTTETTTTTTAASETSESFHAYVPVDEDKAVTSQREGDVTNKDNEEEKQEEDDDDDTERDNNNDTKRYTGDTKQDENNDDDEEKKEEDDKMTALVGKRHSFTIKRQTASGSQLSSALSSTTASSSSSSSTASASGRTLPSSRGMEENAGDVYVYRDSRGDVYVMEDITDQPEATTTTSATTAFARTADDSSTSGAASFDFQGLSSNDSVTVDTEQVDVHKAKEVISAFLTDGSTARAVHSGEPLRDESTVSVRGGGQRELSLASLDQSSGFEVVAGNVGVQPHTATSAAGDIAQRNENNISLLTIGSGNYGSGSYSTGQQLHHTGLTPTYGAPQHYSYHNQQQQQQQYESSPPAAATGNQQQSLTVSTTSRAVVEEQSELQINIPRNAVPVLPVPLARLNSTSTTSDITPMILNDTSSYSLPLPSQPPFSPPHPPQQQQPFLASSSLASHAAYGSEGSFGGHTYVSQTTLDRNSVLGQSREQERSYGSASAGSVGLTRLGRKASDSSLSSEGDERRGGRAQYRVVNLTRTDSDKQDRSYTAANTSSAVKSSSRQVFDGGRVYDSGPSYYEKPVPASSSSSSSAAALSRVTVISNVNVNTSFGENDSQYGSQTSKATSAGDQSPTDEHLYRIVRAGAGGADTSMSSSSPAASPASPPARPQQGVVYRALDKQTRVTADYQQRELNRSHETLFRQRNKAADVWRVDRFSRSEPDLWGKTLTTLPREMENEKKLEEVEGGGKVYRVVRTGYGDQAKARTRRSLSSDDSDGDDSGVDGGKRYRTVSRVEVTSSKRRSNSTGSLRGDARFSLRPRSPSPSRDYRVSKVQRQASWERQREASRDNEEGGSVYRVTRVTSSEDLPRDLEPYGAHRYRSTWSAKGGREDENNNDSGSLPFKVVHTSPTEKGYVTDEESFRRSREIRAVSRRTTPRSFDASGLSSSKSAHRRSTPILPSMSPLQPPSPTPGPSPGERHRTVITVQVNQKGAAPTTHHTETEGAQYRVVNVKSSDDPSSDAAGRRTQQARATTAAAARADTVVSSGGGGGVYTADAVTATTTTTTRHEQTSFPSPVSGYESDPERSSASGKMYTVNTSAHSFLPSRHQQQQQQQQRPVSPAYDNSPSPREGRRYVVSSNLRSSDVAFSKGEVEEERVTLREVKPRVASPPPLSQQQQPPSLSRPGEWHKTTIDINRNIISTDMHRPGPSHSSSYYYNSSNAPTMAPLQHQQRAKSYVVFNSLDNIRDERHDAATTRGPPSLQRSSSQNFASERQFRVMSPTPTPFSDAPFPGRFAGDLHASPARAAASLDNAVDDPPDAYRREVYEERTYEMVQETSHIMPEASQPTTAEQEKQEEKDLRVLRGKILIRNRLDDSRDQDDFLHNMNVFDTGFHLGKDNPLYQSDPDIYKSLEEELKQQEQRSKSIGQEVTQDITWETVDRVARRHKGEEVQASPKPRRKQNLSTMLLSKLASIDSKDIRQHIDVQHHHEEIYGDVHLVHADGSPARAANTSNFDSVNENVELILKQGKAFVIIKVIAERIVPIDYEFNVWRKSQAIVTRNIEIDLHATEQRRRLYEHVMETGGRMPDALEGSRRGDYHRDDYGAATMRSDRRSGCAQEGEEEEHKLSSLETLRLFSQILEVAEGKGDTEDTEMRTRQEIGQLPGPASSMDLLY